MWTNINAVFTACTYCSVSELLVCPTSYCRLHNSHQSPLTQPRHFEYHLRSSQTGEKQTEEFIRLNALTFEFSLLLTEKLFHSIPYAEIFNTTVLITCFYSNDSSVCVGIAHQVTPLISVSQYCRRYVNCWITCIYSTEDSII